MTKKENSVILGGVVAQEPKSWFCADIPVTGFPIRINEYVETEYGVEFLPQHFYVKTFGDVAQYVNEHLHRNASIVVEGRLKNETWNNKEEKTVVVIGLSVRLIESDQTLYSHQSPKRANKFTREDINYR